MRTMFVCRCGHLESDHGTIAGYCGKCDCAVCDVCDVVEQPEIEVKEDKR